VIDSVVSQFTAAKLVYKLIVIKHWLKVKWAEEQRDTKKNLLILPISSSISPLFLLVS